MKKPIKILCLLTLIALMGFMVMGCGNDAEEAVAPDANGEVEEKGTIVVGASGEFFPLNFMEDGELKGFEVDVWNEIAARTGYTVEFKTAKFAGLFGMLDAGQIDTICHQIAINPERQEKYSFTESYVNSNYQLVVKKDSELNTLEDFTGTNIGVVAGGQGDIMLQKVNTDNNLDIQIQGYEGTAAMDMDVVMGRIDARLGPAIQTNAAIKQNDLDLKVTDVVIFSETAAFPFAKGEKSDAKIKDVNVAIEEMKADGSLSELSLKWFEVDATKN